jgi:hypothetical protein
MGMRWKYWEDVVWFIAPMVPNMVRKFGLRPCMMSMSFLLIHLPEGFAYRRGCPLAEGVAPLLGLKNFVFLCKSHKGSIGGCWVERNETQQLGVKNLFSPYPQSIFLKIFKQSESTPEKSVKKKIDRTCIWGAD